MLEDVFVHATSNEHVFEWHKVFFENWEEAEGDNRSDWLVTSRTEGKVVQKTIV